MNTVPEDHADDAPVMFSYAASCNIAFHGVRESGITWGDWREMSDKEKDEAFAEFVWQELGVEVRAVGDES